MILAEDSYCHSGLLLNNNAENKCELHKTDAFKNLINLKGLINVLEGSVSDFT
jgi:hypothetical protein